MATADPALPDRRTLIRFLTERPDLSVADAAALLGWTPGALLRRARDEGALLPDGRIAWSGAAFWLLQVWPRAALLRVLGKHSGLIPRGLHLIEVRWRLPLYLVRAVEQQAALRRAHCDEIRNETVEDYVACALDLLIDDETVAALNADPTFREAYDYPGAEDPWP
jgi:hypothetical protein